MRSRSRSGRSGSKPGDEVVVPSFTFYASAEAIVNAGARPVFCDVDPDTRNVTPETVRAVLTPAHGGDRRGRPVRPARRPRRSFASSGCPVLEDAAQAAGASLNGRRAGSLGDVATFSFYPSKNLGAFGDGGAITTDDDEVAELVRSLRFHGSRDKQTFDYVGYNSRLDELQAAILRVAAPRARRLVRRPACRRPGLRRGRPRAVRDAARRPRRRRGRLAPVRGHSPARGCGSSPVSASTACRRGPTTARRCIASRPWRRTRRRRGRCRSPTSWRGPTWPCR